MPLPAFVSNWLPPGHHTTTWEEISTVFGGKQGSKRAHVLANLLIWRDAVRSQGIAGRVLLNGSFVSAREHPGDFDCILIYDVPTETLMNQDSEVASVLSYGYWKGLGYGDVWILAEASVQKYPHLCSLDMFDEDKHTGVPKGIVEVPL